MEENQKLPQGVTPEDAQNAVFKKLFWIAVDASKKAYAPYSGFKVGAALLCSDNTVYTGCNVENAAYPLGTCAEKNAICKAVSDGRTDFTAFAIAGSKDEDYSKPCYPCGSCRQVMSEFCDENFKVVVADGYIPLGELLPYNFKL